jgi:very-short-patch-repair endonuclease
VVNVSGMPATSIERTVGEVCSRLTLVEAVVIADAATHSRRVSADQLLAWANSNGGRRGIRNLRQVLRQVEPAAESPMESRLRMLLVLRGLPRPKAQVDIHDSWGRLISRLDLYYAERRLGIEYDGGVHKEMLVEDNRRQNRLLAVGVRLLRFTAADVFTNPAWVLSQVRSLLAAEPATAGARGIQRAVRPRVPALAGNWRFQE